MTGSNQPPQFATDFSGPMHYLGSRLLSLPDVSGHMRVDHAWLHDIFALIHSNTHGETYERAIEPFAGSASWSLAAMSIGFANEYVINDSDEILIDTHRLIQQDPARIKSIYAELEHEFCKASSFKDAFIRLIERYNASEKNDQKSAMLPFIINYSWGGMLFHDSQGNLVYREHDVSGQHYSGYLDKPNLTLDQFYNEVDRASVLYNEHKVVFCSADFQTLISHVSEHDFVMLNPPYPENIHENDGASGMYRELYSREKLHRNLKTCVDQLESVRASYIMTYGYYDPDQDAFVLRDADGKRKNYFKLQGYPECSIGEVLDQMYLSENLKVPESLRQNVVKAVDVLDEYNLLSPEVLVQKYKSVLND